MIAYLRSMDIKLMNYCDDILIVAHSKELASKHASVVQSTLLRAGFVINDKSNLTPRQITPFLGVILNTHKMEVSLPEDKLENIRSKTQDLISISNSLHFKKYIFYNIIY